MYRWLLAVIFSVLILTGCAGGQGADASTVQPRVVTGITVTYENGPISARRYYTTSAKMRAVLNYLRWIDPYGVPQEDPSTVSGSSFRIILSYSDGREKLYLQKADRYLMEEGQSWKQIDPDKAMTLGQILGEMESD